MADRMLAPGQTPRHDFGKIKTFLPLPNLIDVQRRSYEDFLQMDLLPAERSDVGLEAVFRGVFPFSDFRETCALEYVSYRIGDLASRSGRLEGIQHLRFSCEHCGATVRVKDARANRVECQVCGHPNPNKVTIDEVCGTPVELRLPFTVAECQERGLTYAVPLKVTFRLKVFDKENAPTGKSAPKEWPIRDIKEEEVYFGDIPLMTDNGTFIINGTERVIVSQLHRSPGVFFTREGAHTLIGKIIPYRGSWVEFEIDSKGLFGVRIDRKRKFPGTVFLRALGLESDEQILKKFYSAVGLTFEKGKAHLVLPPDVLVKEELRLKHLRGIKKDGKIFADVKLTADQREKLAAGTPVTVAVDPAKLGRILFAVDVVDLASGEVLYEAGSEVPDDLATVMTEKQATPVEVLFPDWEPIGETLIATLRKDSVKTKREALLEIYKRMRPGDPPTDESAKNLFVGMFFDPRKYDFSRVGRYKFNIRMGLSTSLDQKTLSSDDFFVVIDALLKLKRDIGKIDDIDNLGNRRVRCVGELLENQFRIGLVRMERAIKEKMSVHQDIDSAMPHDLINSKPVIAAIKEFFGSSQLSQFMDQTNPLSEVTHKRRLSALGPGGLSRERAGFEVRDVHATHYGRICPIETPEGPNIGLISSLSTYARISEYGFIEAPYKKVRDGRVLEHFEVVTEGDSGWKKGAIVEASELEAMNAKLKKAGKKLAVGRPTAFYLPAWEEEDYSIAQANEPLEADGRFQNDRVQVTLQGEFKAEPRDKVQFMDVSPKQLVSVAAALIPFLEHDDANRALMGSNMQRQSVPLLRTEPPIVGTGLEGVVARDSGAVVLCKRDGIVDTVDARRIIVRVEGIGPDGKPREFGADIYPLLKFRRSNQNTCINQKPIVKEGERVDGGPGPGRRSLHLGRRARPRPEHPRRLHAVARLQLRGRDPHLREDGQGGLLHLHPHRGVRDRGPRDQARPRGDHQGHPERLRARAPRPRRVGDHPDRRERQAGRHPRRQGHAQGRDPADPRGEAPPRHLRREGRRRPRRLAQVPPGHRGRRRRREDLHPQGRREAEGRPGQADPRRGDRLPQQGRRRRDPDRADRGAREDRAPPRGPRGPRGRRRPAGERPRRRRATSSRSRRSG